MLTEQSVASGEASAPNAIPFRLRPRRRRRRLGLIALVVIVVLLFTGAGGSYLLYRSFKGQVDHLQAQLTFHLTTGEHELEAAKRDLSTANSSSDPKAAERARVHFISARLHFVMAMQIADNSETLRQAEEIPYVADQARSRHKAVDSIAGMGANVSAAGEDFADVAGLLLHPSSEGQAGHALLTVIDQVNSKLGSVKIKFQAAQKAAAAVDIRLLPPSQQSTFVKARDTIVQALKAIDEFQALVPAIREILGANGVRNYLIEQVNPAELRPGGGFIGTYSVVRADNGTLSLVASGDAFDLSKSRASAGQPGYIAPPGPIREFVPNTGYSFIDSNFSPDFPSNAQAAEQFAQAQLHYPIHGVFAIDYYAVARILALTGTMTLPGSGLTVSSDNLINMILQYDLAQYTDPSAREIHKVLLSSLAGPLFQKVTSMSASQWPNLIKAMNDLAGARHVQAYFNNGDVQKMIDGFGMSGVHRRTAAADYMMEVEANLGGTKANYFITRNYEAELTRDGNTLHHTVHVDVKDDMPYEYRPDEFYRAYIRMFILDNATNASGDLVAPRYPAPPPQGGLKMIDGWITIHGYGHDRLMTFTWDTPWTADSHGVEQIYWQKQPGTSNDHINVIWHDGQGHTYNATGDLGQDRVITLSPAGVTIGAGQVGTAQLPSLSLS